MTIETKFAIGQPVWEATGVYRIPSQRIIFAIKMQYNETGQLELFYTFDSHHSFQLWHKESELFTRNDEILEYLKNNQC